MNKILILIFILIFLFLLQPTKIENMNNSPPTDKDVIHYLDAACQSCLKGSECDSKQLGNCTYICSLGTVTEDEIMEFIDENVCYRELTFYDGNVGCTNTVDKIKREIKQKKLDSEEDTAELKRLRGLISDLLSK
jgi:hypothetical protein